MQLVEYFLVEYEANLVQHIQELLQWDLSLLQVQVMQLILVINS